MRPAAGLFLMLCILFLRVDALYEKVRADGRIVSMAVLMVCGVVISDAHAGLVSAIRKFFLGASWQRCKVRIMRNILAYFRGLPQPGIH